MRSQILSSRIAAWRRKLRGNAILEAAFVFPILLMLTFGTVEYGYFFYVKHSLQGAAREGARAAIPPSATSAEVDAAIANAMSAAGLAGSGYAKTYTAVNQTPGTPITVTVTCTWGTVGSGYRMMGPLSIGVNKQVKGVTVMRKEG